MHGITWDIVSVVYSTCGLSKLVRYITCRIIDKTPGFIADLNKNLTSHLFQLYYIGLRNEATFKRDMRIVLHRGY